MTDLERAAYRTMSFDQLCRCDIMRISDRAEREEHRSVIEAEMAIKRDPESIRQRGYPHNR